MNRKHALAAASVGLLTIPLSVASHSSLGTRAQTVERPNIVLIMTDDQDYDSMPVMRNLMSFPEGSWINFTQGFISHSVCCPSRATVLTGQRASTHGAIGNDFCGEMDDTNTLPVWLDNAGYETALIGKYLNGYPWSLGEGYVPPGWDVFEGMDYKSDEDRLSDRAVQFLEETSDPFFLFLSYGAPHRSASPPARYRQVGAYMPPDRPNFNEADMSDKPRVPPPLTASTIADERAERLDAQRELMAVDDGVQRVMDTLRTKGELDDTLIVYISDNGYMWGNHREYRKVCHFEECSQVPLLMRYPGQIGNRNENRLVSNIDLAWTIADFAGITPTLPQDGRTLMPLLNSTASEWSDEVFLERFRPSYIGLRTREWKYVKHTGGALKGAEELYDLINDPYELENLAGVPAYQAVQAQMAARTQAAANQPPVLPPAGTPTPTATPGGPTSTPSTTPTATTTKPPTATPEPGSCPAPVVGNLIRNGDFEAGKTAWSFYSDVSGNSFTVGTESGYPCGNVGRVALGATGSNIQLYQYGMAIQSGTEYRLRFTARANGNQSFGLYLQMHDKPYTDLGLSVRSVNLTSTWQTFEYVFTATGSTSSARLRIWLANSSAGSEFAFDDVVLAPVGAFGATPTNTPVPNTPTATPTATATTEPATATATATPTATIEGPTETATATPTATDDAPTATPTWTPTATAVVPTETPTATTVAPTETPTATPSPTATPLQCPLPVPGDVLRNGDFEGGESGWSFYSNVSGNTFSATSEAGYPCGNTGQIDIGATGNNVQLFQYNFPVERGTQYRLRFDARADASREIGLYLQLHKSPYTNLGLSVGSVGLTSNWQTFEYVFTATGTTSNARLRLWFAGQPAGSRFTIDNVSLAALP